MRIAIGLEYKGTNYHGWQKQKPTMDYLKYAENRHKSKNKTQENVSIPTIQEEVEKALSKVADRSVQITCAGRTDVGVHAAGQVIHFNTEVIRSAQAWVFGGNNYLPPDIRLQWAKPVTENFHARFSALSRHYRYFIYNHKVPSALSYRRATFFPFHLQVDLMQEATQYLIGEHDFSAFRGSSCQSRSTIRTVTLLQVQRQDRMIVLDIRANAFLQHMVRNIVGVLLEIGCGKRQPIWAQEILMSKDRKLGAATASSDGLYLWEVEYPQVALEFGDIK